MQASIVQAELSCLWPDSNTAKAVLVSQAYREAQYRKPMSSGAPAKANGRPESIPVPQRDPRYGSEPRNLEAMYKGMMPRLGASTDRHRSIHRLARGLSWYRYGAGREGRQQE